MDVQPAEAWGEPDVNALYFDADGVQALANIYDSDNKLTRLNNKKSLWNALEKGGCNHSLVGSSYKIPPHVVAATTWNGALTNAVNYGMMSMDEQRVERACYAAASVADKRQLSTIIEQLHRKHPSSPGPRGVANEPNALDQALDRAWSGS